MADPIRITIAFDTAGQPIIREAISDLNALSSSARLNAAQIAQGGRALRQFENDVNRVSAALQTRLGGAVGFVSNGMSNLINLAGSLGRKGFYTVIAGAAATSYAFQKLSKDFLEVNEQFSNLEITLRSTYRNALIARDLRNELAKITAMSPVPFRDLADATRTFSVMPSTRGKIASQAAQGTLSDKEGFYRQSIRLVEQMIAFRPDKTEEDAIFAIREAMSGQFRSLVRRFDIPLRYVASQVGKTGDQLATDPDMTFKALQKTFGNIISPQAVREYARQPKVLLSNLKEQIFDLPALQVGDSGFYTKLLEKINRFYEGAVEFIKNSIKPYAERVSKALESVMDTLGNAAYTLANKALNVFGFGEQQRPDLSFFQRIAEALASAAEKLGNSLPDIFNRVEVFFNKLYPLLDFFAKFIAKIFDLFTKYPIQTLLIGSQLGSLPGLAAGFSRNSITRIGATATSSNAALALNSGAGAATTFWQGFTRSFNTRLNAGGIAQAFPWLGSLRSVNPNAGPLGNLRDLINVGPRGAQLNVPQGQLTAAQQAVLGISRASAMANPALYRNLGANANALAIAQGSFQPSGRDLTQLVNQTPSGRFRLAPGIAATLTPEERLSLGLQGRSARGYLNTSVVQNMQAQRAAEAAGGIRAGMGARLGGAMMGAAGAITSSLVPVAVVAGVTYGVIAAFEALQKSADKAGAALVALAFSKETPRDSTLREQSVVDFGAKLVKAEEALKVQNEAFKEQGTLPGFGFKETDIQARAVSSGAMASTYGGISSTKYVYENQGKAATLGIREAYERFAALSQSIANLESFADKTLPADLEKKINGVDVSVKEVRSNPDLWAARLTGFKKSLQSHSEAFDFYFSQLPKVFKDGYKPEFITSLTDPQMASRNSIQEKVEALTHLPGFLQKNMADTYGRLTVLAENLPEPEQMSFDADLQLFRTGLNESAHPFTKMRDGMDALGEAFSSLDTTEEALNNRLNSLVTNTRTANGITETVRASEIRKAQGVFSAQIAAIEKASVDENIHSYSVNGVEMSDTQVIAMLKARSANIGNAIDAYFANQAQARIDRRATFYVTQVEYLGSQVMKALPEFENATTPERFNALSQDFADSFNGVKSKMSADLALKFQGVINSTLESLQGIAINKDLEGAAYDREIIRVETAKAKIFSNFSDGLIKYYEKIVTPPVVQDFAPGRGGSVNTAAGFQESLGLYFPDALARGASVERTAAMEGASLFAGQAGLMANSADGKNREYWANQNKLIERFNVANAARLFDTLPDLTNNEYGAHTFDALLESLNAVGDPGLAFKLENLRSTFLANTDGPENLDNYVKKLQVMIPLLHEAAQESFADAAQYKGVDNDKYIAYREQGSRFLQQAGDAERGLQDTVGDGAAKTFAAGWDSVFTQYKVMMMNFKEVGTNVAASFSAAFGSAFDSFITNSRSAGEAAQDFFKSIIRNAANAFAQKAVQMFLGSMFSGLGSLFGGGGSTKGLGDFNMGNIGTVAEGGYIRGGTGTRDDVPLLAMGGEYMLRKSAVSSLTAKYGSRVMDMLNEGIIPHLRADGGSIPALAGGNPLSSPSQAIKIAPNALSARPNGGQNNEFNFNVTVNEGQTEGAPGKDQSGGLDSDSMLRVVRGAVVAEINRQRRQSGALAGI